MNGHEGGKRWNVLESSCVFCREEAINGEALRKSEKKV